MGFSLNNFLAAGEGNPMNNVQGFFTDVEAAFRTAAGDPVALQQSGADAVADGSSGASEAKTVDEKEELAPAALEMVDKLPAVIADPVEDVLVQIKKRPLLSAGVGGAGVYALFKLFGR
jgi:hypothetical protein